MGLGSLEDDLEPRCRRRGAPRWPFERRYTAADIRLLAEVDATLGQPRVPRQQQPPTHRRSRRNLHFSGSLPHWNGLREYWFGGLFAGEIQAALRAALSHWRRLVARGLVETVETTFLERGQC